MRNNLISLSGAKDFLYVGISGLRLGSMELNTVRPFFLETTSQVNQLTALKQTVTRGEVMDSSSQDDSLPTGSQRYRDEDGAPLPKQFKYGSQTQ